MPDLQTRFWQKVDKRGVDQCWPWTASKWQNGYPMFCINNRPTLATHTALRLDGRERPGAAFALHSCDNPSCVNHQHLRWGTFIENARDMVSRGRHPTSQAKLRRSDIPKIRRDHRTDAAIAKDYGVSRSTINLVRARKTWASVQ